MGGDFITDGKGKISTVDEASINLDKIFNIYNH